MKEIVCKDYEEWVAADVDGVLGVDEKATIEAHLRACDRCRAVRQEQTLVRSTVRQSVPLQVTPAALRQQITSALAEAGVTPLHPKRPARRLLLAGALAAGFALVVLPLLRSTPQHLLSVLVSDAQAAETGQLAMEMLSADVDAVRGYYRESGEIAFENPADDLRPLGFRLVGANVAHIGEVTTTLTLYEDESAKVVCRRFPSGSLALPTGGERVGHADLFTIDGVTIAITHLGDVTCCLATTMPRDAFRRRLAKAEHRH